MCIAACQNLLAHNYTGHGYLGLIFSPFFTADKGKERNILLRRKLHCGLVSTSTRGNCSERAEQVNVRPSSVDSVIEKENSCYLKSC